MPEKQVITRDNSQIKIFFKTWNLENKERNFRDTKETWRAKLWQKDIFWKFYGNVLPVSCMEFELSASVSDVSWIVVHLAYGYSYLLKLLYGKTPVDRSVLIRLNVSGN